MIILGSHGEGVIPGILGPGSSPGLVFLTWIIHLQHHIRLQTETLSPAKLSCSHYGDIQLPRALASEAVEASLYEAVLTKRRVCL